MSNRLCKYSGCQKAFPRNGRKEYCSVSCRDRARYLRPGEKEKQRAREKIYNAKNRERLNAYSREFYKTYILKKLKDQPWLTLLRGTKSRAAQKQVKFNLDAAWFKKRWTGKCELTGIAFNTPEKRVGYKSRNFSPSVDRIDPKIGYLKNNCRIVLWAINSFKRDGTDTEMYQIAGALTKAHSNSVAIPVEAFLSLPT